MTRHEDSGRVDARHRKGRQPTAREVALDVLTRVEQDRAYSNLMLNQILTNRALSRQEAALATELVYGTIQRMNSLDFFLNRFVAKGLSRLQPWVRSLLRMSMYQIRYLDRIPPHAAVHEAVELAKARGHQGVAGLVNGVLRNVLRHPEQLAIPRDLPPDERIALEHSHPVWLVRRWIHRYGEETAAAMCEANNQPPGTSIRVNRLKGNREQLAGLLAREGIETRPSALAPDGLLLVSGGHAADSPLHGTGHFTIQDESSMLVGRVVSPEPGMKVLDCCAAPGGKTTHLAELMDDRGEVYACDIYEHKEQLILSHAKRLGLGSIRTIVSDALRLGEHFAEGTFDRILLDAPCTGLGVLRRKPDIKWMKRENEIQTTANLQRKLLQAVHPLLKPGGILVYSTCSTEPEENERLIRQFVRETPGFALEAFPAGLLPAGSAEEEGRKGMLQLLPHQFHSDGFFIARLRKEKG